MVSNGRLTPSQLSLIQTDLYLNVKAARAFKRLQAAAKKQGRIIAAARKAGAYRSLAVQKAIRDAFKSGSIAKKQEWNLDLSSTVEPALPGASNHGWGTAVDIVGTTIDRDFEILARKYGFTRPFGKDDPRHFVHDGKMACSPLVPTKTVKHQVYVVRPNDTLSAVAARFRTTVQHLMVLNTSIHDANKIYVGQKVNVT